jgi:hypothetical protein
LLVERAQYITGATGAAIALRDEDEMVCRASSGPSAPEVGALLQVNSGLSGESVRTRQTLRCDDAFTDARVNRESCEALGIRSVVVMPLLRGEEVIGVFELFSDKANVFETRDLVALERMGTMVHTALEHSTAALGLPPMLGEAIQPMRSSETPAVPPAADGDEVEASENEHSSDVRATASSQALHAPPRSGLVFHGRSMPAAGAAPAAEVAQAASADRVPKQVSPATSPTETGIPRDVLEETVRKPALPSQTRAMPVARSFEALVARADQDLILSDIEAARNQPASPSPVPASANQGLTANVALTESAESSAPLPAKRAAVANLKKCQECGFPVSEGRQFCLDCEKKKGLAGGPKASAVAPTAQQAEAAVSPQAEPVAAPNFMHSEAAEASWLATHKFMVIALVLALIGILALLRLR